MESVQLSDDVLYHIFQYNPRAALNLSAADRVEVVFLLTGVEVTRVRSSSVLGALVRNSLEELILYSELYPWLEETILPEELVFALGEEASVTTMAELLRLGYPLTSVIFDQVFLHGDEEAVRWLLDNNLLPEAYIAPAATIREQVAFFEWLLRHEWEWVQGQPLLL